METSLPELLSALKDGLVLTPEIFGMLDCDEILSSRDDDPDFDKNWNEAYNALDKKFSEQDISPEVDQMIEEIRENSFSVASAGTEEHELASSISDDFELFARSIVLEYSIPFSRPCGKPMKTAKSPVLRLSPSAKSEQRSSATHEIAKRRLPCQKHRKKLRLESCLKLIRSCSKILSFKN